MLEKQIVPISFAGGVDTKTDQQLVQPGKLTLLENGSFSKGKAITKRNGYVPIGLSIAGSSSKVTDGAAVAEFNSELLLFGSSKVYAYLKGADEWASKGDAYSLRVGYQQIVRSTRTQASPDMQILNGVGVYAYTDSSGGVRATVSDIETGSFIQANVLLNASGKSPRCVIVDAFIYIVYVVNVDLRVRKIDPLNPTVLGDEITLESDVEAANPWVDCASIGSNCVITYNTGTYAKTLYMNRDGLVGTALLGLPTPAEESVADIRAITVCVEETTGLIAVFVYDATDGLEYFVYNADFTQKVAKTVISDPASAIPRVTATFVDSSNIRVFFEVTAAATYNHYVRTCVVTTAASVGSITDLKRSVGLSSKCYTQGAYVYVTVAFDTTLQATYFVVRQDGLIVAKLLSDRAGGLAADCFLPSFVIDPSDVYRVPLTVKNKLVSESGAVYTVTGIAESSVSFEHGNQYSFRTLGENLHIVGGFLSMYDGSYVVEHGFHVFPENVSATPGSVVSGGMDNGQYLYYVVYEWIDNAGQTHRSAPDTGTTVTTSAGAGLGKVTLTIPTLRLTAKTNVVISVYRTKAAGTIAYKVTSSTSPLFNDQTQDTVTYADQANDSTIGSNEILYTTGGVLENIAPGSCSIIDVYKNRIALAGLEDPLQFWISKEHVFGEGVAFNYSLAKSVDKLGGKITALKFMDDKLIIFKENIIFATAGDAANDLGLDDNLSIPTLVTSDCGCKYPESVVYTPVGLMFKSNKGIYLLDRSLQLTYIGADVEAFNAQSVTSSELIENKNQVRFLTDDGVTLIYDYYFQQWATWTNHEGVDAQIWQGNYVYLKPTGVVMVETDNHFKDGNVGFRLRIATAWIKMAGLQGYQRVRRAAVLGNYKSPHTLMMRVGYDYEQFYGDNILFAAGQIIDTSLYGDDALYGDSSVYGGVGSNVYQFRAHLRKQKCEAIRFLFEDVTAGTPGESYSLSELSLEVGVKRGLNKLRSNRSVG